MNENEQYKAAINTLYRWTYELAEYAGATVEDYAGFPADSCIILAFFFFILHEATPYRTLPERKHGEEDRTNR